MNKKETLKLLKYLNSYYGNRFEIPNNDKELLMRVETWHNFLGEYDYKIIETVTNKLISGMKWAPTPGEIAKEIESMKTPEVDQLTAGEAWEMVLDKIESIGYNYYPNEVKAALPDKACRAAEAVGFHKIVMEGAENTFLYNHFKETYNLLSEKEDRIKRIPGKIRKESIKLAEKFRAPQLEGDTQ